jgi:hypothetical protein
VPGYAGYVPRLKSENLYGKSFAKESGHAINNEHVVCDGFAAPPDARFKTSSGIEYTEDQHRYLQDKPKPAEVKDQTDADEFHDAE